MTEESDWDERLIRHRHTHRL